MVRAVSLVAATVVVVVRKETRPVVGRAVQVARVVGAIQVVAALMAPIILEAAGVVATSRTSASPKLTLVVVAAMEPTEPTVELGRRPLRLEPRLQLAITPPQVVVALVGLQQQPVVAVEPVVVV